MIEHGDYALRGSIMDVFPMGSPALYRIDWLDDEVDGLRTFDPESQRSTGTVPEIRVLPAREFPLTPTAIERFRGNWLRGMAVRLIAVFEPRSWSSRLAVFQDEYAGAFAAADYVVIASVFDSQKVSEKGKSLDTARLIDCISEQNKSAFALPDADEIIAHLLPQLREGDVVAIMSNGGFGGIHEKLLAALKEQ